MEPAPAAVAAIAQLAEWIVRTTWQAAVLVALVGAVHLLIGRRLAPRWRFALWGLVVVRLLLPVVPASPWSVFNLSLPGSQTPEQRAGAAARARVIGDDATPSMRVVIIPDSQSQAAANTADVEKTSHAAPASPAPAAIDWRRTLVLVWLAGAVIVGVRAALGAMVLRRRLRRAAQPAPDVLALLDGCRAELGVPARVPALVTDAVAGPALFGLLRPRLLLPPTLLAQLSASELRFVLLHELAHVKRRDALTNVALLAAGALHWFNPLARLAIARCRAERELACDELVMDATAPGARADYGRAVLRVAEALCAAAAAAGAGRRAGGAAGPGGAVAARAEALLVGGPPAIGMIHGRSQLRRRITMISTMPDVPRHVRRRRRPVLPVLLVLGVCSCALTDREEDAAADASAASPPATAAATAEPAAGSPPAPGADVLNAANAAPPAEWAPVGAAAAAADAEGDPKTKATPRADRPGASIVAAAAPGAADPFADELTPEEQAVQAVLDRPIDDVSLEQVALDEVLAFFRDVSSANLVVDWKALDAAGVAKNAPVTVRVRNVKLSQALRLVLDQAGGDNVGLAYEIKGAILKVTTQEELNRDVLTRVYDIADLLVHIPNFDDSPQLGVTGPLKEPTALDAPQQDQKKAPDPGQARAEAVEHITTLLKETVDPDSWRDNGGSVGGMRELQGQLIVTQTRENQRQIVRLLVQLRETRAVQVQVEARFVTLNLEALDEAIRQKLRPAADKPAGEASSVFLTDAEVKDLLDQAKDRDAATILSAPRMMLFNGQRAYVVVAHDTPFVSGFTAVETGTPGQVRYEPQRSMVKSGVVIDVAATASADRKHVVLTLRPQLALLGEMGVKPLESDDPGAKDLLVQVPQLSEQSLRTTVRVPDRGTAVLGGFAHSVTGGGDGDDDKATTKPVENLYLLVRPIIVVNTPDVRAPFPLISN